MTLTMAQIQSVWSGVQRAEHQGYGSLHADGCFLPESEEGNRKKVLDI